jgi:hypothetical protein
MLSVSCELFLIVTLLIERNIEMSDSESDDDDLDDDLGDTTNAAYLKSQQTVMNHFDKFIKKCHRSNPVTYPHNFFRVQDFNSVSKAKDFVGRFCNYIIKDVKIKRPKCTLNYISKLRVKVETDDIENQVFTHRWYGALRLKVVKEYVAMSLKTGSRLSDSAPAMTINDLRVICTILFENDDRSGASHRCLLVCQWQALGRISEVGNIRSTDFSVRLSRYVRALLVMLNTFL